MVAVAIPELLGRQAVVVAVVHVALFPDYLSLPPVSQRNFGSMCMAVVKGLPLAEQEAAGNIPLSHLDGLN